MKPVLLADRLAIDVVLAGPCPIRPEALYADVWRWIGEHTPLHGQPRQRMTFGLLDTEGRWGRLPRLRLYSTDRVVSVAIIRRLLETHRIRLADRWYEIVERRRLLDLEAAPPVVRLVTPAVVRKSRRDGAHGEILRRLCVPPEHHEYQRALNRTMRQKLHDLGFTDAELPDGELLEVVAPQRRTYRPSPTIGALIGAVGLVRLAGPPAVRTALVLSGIGTKSALGCGLAVPVAGVV